MFSHPLIVILLVVKSLNLKFSPKFTSQFGGGVHGLKVFSEKHIFYRFSRMGGGILRLNHDVFVPLNIET